MKPSHTAKQCKSDFKCFNCDSRHHIAVCTFDSSLSGSSNFNVSYSTKILLQFGRATVTSVDENQSTNLCLLFDSGSQFRYIAPEGKNK